MSQWPLSPPKHILKFPVLHFIQHEKIVEKDYGVSFKFTFPDLVAWLCGVQVERAVKDGYDLRGFMYWTLIDNFEYAPLCRLNCHPA